VFKRADGKRTYLAFNAGKAPIRCASATAGKLASAN
jgi:hypothetical protein